MDFIRFAADTTNIFPAANSKTGNQLLTEFNLKSRESVVTPSAVKYSIGPSFTHSQDDFVVRLQQDELGVAVSSTTLEITDGRAVINGHYIESLSNVTVDIAEANRELLSKGMNPLKGHLAIGLRAFYSTERTLAASMIAEDSNDMWPGIQIVILPIDKIANGYFVTPTDSPENENLVTAHLKLADFYYINGGVRDIRQNENKVQCLEAMRVSDFDGLLDKHYVRKDGLNPKKMYTMAGKSNDGSKVSNSSTWCDSTDSLIVWDKVPELADSSDDMTYVNTNTTSGERHRLAESLNEASVMYWGNGGFNKYNAQDNKSRYSDETIALVLPHKEPDGGMWSTDGKQQHYLPRIMALPQADYSLETPGTVTSSYTKSIKSISEKINNFYHLPYGKQRAYITTLESRTQSTSGQDYTAAGESHTLPHINPSWSVGDYVLVEKDNTVSSSTESGIQAPSTLYVVLPPQVSQVTLLDRSPKTDPDDLPVGFNGTEIMKVIQPYGGNDDDDKDTVLSTIASQFQFDDQAAYNETFGIQSNYSGSTVTPLRGTFTQISKSSTYATGEFNSTGKATPPILLEGENEKDSYFDYQDYVTLEVMGVPDGKDSKGYVTKKDYYYYFAVTNVVANTTSYSDPILLTGSIPYATTDTIGGFLNVEETNKDAGYIIRDETGHLKLLDYSLLRSGILAYQLGHDYTFGDGLGYEEIQQELDEYVNDRVAFLDDDEYKSQFASYSPEGSKFRTPVVKISLSLPKSDSAVTVRIKDIDSRFGTAAHIAITGEADKNTTIVIENCEKLIMSYVKSSNTLENYSSLTTNEDFPRLVVKNCCVLYDPSAINAVYLSHQGSGIEGTGFDACSLWLPLEDDLATDDANVSKLTLDGMTIRETTTPVIAESKDFWTESVVNDYHYSYALQSLTFNEKLQVIGMGIYIRNDSTENIKLGKTLVVGKFDLQSNIHMEYPELAVANSNITVEGSFTTAYPTDSSVGGTGSGYITTDTKFAMNTATSHLSILSDSYLVTDFASPDKYEYGAAIDEFEASKFRVFYGSGIASLPQNFPQL